MLGRLRAPHSVPASGGASRVYHRGYWARSQAELRRNPKSRFLQSVLLAAVVVLAGAGIFASVRVGRPSPKAAPAVPVPADGARQPQATPDAAVTALLDAEQRGDHEASFRYLSTASLRAYPDAEAWGKHRTELPEVTGFSVTSVDDTWVVTTVSHTPGLDPFVGLSTAQDTQRWRVVRESSGWLVDADPEISFDLPNDGAATEAALRWAKAAQACDKQAALALQVDSELLGAVGGAPRLCRSPGSLRASKPKFVEPGLDSADLVAQYGEAAFAWAKVVQIEGAPDPFGVVLAPIGADWRVLGTTQS